MNAMPNPDNVTLLVLDVDGVLTDGSIMLDDAGQELKRFNVRDGLGLTTWIRLGLQVGVITRRSSAALQHRMNELGISHVIQGSKDKSAALDTLSKETRVMTAHMAFIGDDWPDMPAMRRVGYPIAVADADPHVKKLAAFVTTLPGGRGAVREAIEHLLSAKGLMEQALDFFSDKPA